MVTFREMAAFMDPVEPASTLRELHGMHRWAASEGRISLRSIARRHTSPDRKLQRFLFLNAFLMRIDPKPAWRARAREIGREIQKREVDIAALAEVWIEKIKDDILEEWPSEERPAYVDDITVTNVNSSGLLTISQRFPLDLSQREVHKFEVEGSLFGGDVDALAAKGSLLAELDLGFPHSRLEVYSAHLIAGGRANLQPRLLQIAELVSFFRTTHAPRNVAIIVGDFNIHRHDDEPFEWPPHSPSVSDTLRSALAPLLADSILDHPVVSWPEVVAELLGETYEPAIRTPYEHLTEMLRMVDMQDLWEERNRLGGEVTPGYTSKFQESNVTRIICQPDPANDAFCDDDLPPPEVLPRWFPGIFPNRRDLPNRIDYIFAQQPMEEHEISIDFTRPRRTRLERSSGAPGRDEIDFLSDHAGLMTTLRIVPRV